MNPFKLYDLIQKQNFMKLSLGNVFVDGEDATSYEEWQDNLLDSLATVRHFKDYSNWYLPFDRCTYVISPGWDKRSPSEVKVVTLEDNPGHQITSPIRFTVNLGLYITLKGVYEIKKADTIRDENGVVDSSYFEAQQELFEGSVTTVENLDLHYGPTKRAEYLIACYFQEIAYKSRRSSRTTGWIEMTSEIPDHKRMVEDATTLIKQAASYFTNLIINTKAFVMEVNRASRNKRTGEIKVSSKMPPIYQVINTNILRKKYLGIHDDESDNTKRPHWRRRHERTFRSDHWSPEKRGTTIVIEPIWVGPTENYDPSNNRLYKVRLDIG